MHPQLCRDASNCGGYYVQQSAPHMRAIGKMVRRLLGKVPALGKIPETTVRKESSATSSAKAATTLITTPTIHPMPTLKIDRGSGGVAVAGCSNTADFSVQVRPGLGVLSCVCEHTHRTHHTHTRTHANTHTHTHTHTHTN